MAYEVFIKASFARAYDRLSESDQRVVDTALRRFRHYLANRMAPVGLGVKHLGEQIYEFRAGLSLRVVYFIEGDKIYLTLLGTHDEVRRYLKLQ